MGRARPIAFLLGAGCAAAATSFACGDLGEPAFAGDDGGVTPPEFFDAIAADAAEAEASPTLVPLTGAVLDPDTDAGLPFAVVAIEMGGLDQTNPGNLGADGGIVPTLTINPFYRYGTLTDDAGAFSLDVPSERVGVHVYKSGFFCGVPEAGTITLDGPGEARVLVQPEPTSVVDGGTDTKKPTITGFTATPSILAPGEAITLSARVEAADPESDPLSEQVLAVEPVSGWAGAFAPPEPGTDGAGYPNGIYGRLVAAPLTPGKYTFYLVAATRACVVSEVATQTVLVTLTGEGGEE
jgi:hypothetical protein